MIQLQLGTTGDGTDRRGLLLLALLKWERNTWWEAVVPSRLDQYPSGVAVTPGRSQGSAVGEWTRTSNPRKVTQRTGASDGQRGRGPRESWRSRIASAMTGVCNDLRPMVQRQL